MTTPQEPLPFLRFLGINVHIAEISEAVTVVEQWIRQRTPCRFVVATGMHGIMEARRDPEFKSIVRSADLFLPDGISLLWAARLKGFRVKKRVCGADLMREFFKRAEQSGYRSFFYGDTPETLSALTGNLEEKYPRLQIAGTLSPPFRPLTTEENEQAVKLINESRADIVWVGLGLPKQERWIFENKDKLQAPVAVGVGAAFKFLSGEVKRAPVWIGDNGFEWLWRLVREPRRIWRRVVFDGFRFVWLSMLELSGLKKFN